MITNGVVIYERTVRPADFESKKASVSLSFTVAEDGSDPAAVTATVMQMAMAEVHSRLGIKPPAPVQAPVEVVPAPEPVKKRAKAPPPAEVPAVDPTAIVEPASVIEAAPTAVAVDDPAAIGEPEPEEAPPVVITDKDVRAAVERAVTEGKVGNKAVIGLITEFTGSPGMSMTTIEQAKRGAFMARLKLLYANA